MSANAVVAGSLSEIKFVKTRSVCVLCIEIPIEAAEDAISKFGVPLPGQEIPVAVARLLATPDAVPSEAPSKPADPAKSERGKEAYRSLDAMAQAVTRSSLLCKEKDFARFLEKLLDFVPGRIDTPETCVSFLRLKLGIASRREIGTDERAYEGFRDIEHQFAVFQGRETEPR